MWVVESGCMGLGGHAIEIARRVFTSRAALHVVVVAGQRPAMTSRQRIHTGPAEMKRLAREMGGSRRRVVRCGTMCVRAACKGIAITGLRPVGGAAPTRPVPFAVAASPSPSTAATAAAAGSRRCFLLGCCRAVVACRCGCCGCGVVVVDVAMGGPPGRRRPSSHSLLGRGGGARLVRAVYAHPCT